MIGSTPDLCELRNKHQARELLVPFNFFFTKDEGTSYPLSMAQENNLSL
jgi:hypothetical protein